MADAVEALVEQWDRYAASMHCTGLTVWLLKLRL